MQILLNLIGNSIKFTSQGEIKAIATRLHKNSQAVLSIRVEDTGCGMTSVELENVHKLLDNGNKLQPLQGARIGLAVISGIVKLLDGEVMVESTQEKGSAFTVIIPYTE